MWVKPENLGNMAKLGKTPPHIIHGDPNPKTRLAYPTHTHGLVTVDIPEILMHTPCFGLQGNAFMINMVVGSLMLNPDHYKEFMENSFIKGITGIYQSIDEMTLCLRKVDSSFLAVKKAYNDDPETKFGYAQLYVEGDNDALTDKYYESIPDILSGDP